MQYEVDAEAGSGEVLVRLTAGEGCDGERRVKREEGYE